MTPLTDAIAALVQPGTEHLLRDQPSLRARRAELDTEHLAHIAYLREQHARARALKTRRAASMRRAITAMTEAGQRHRERRAALTADLATSMSLLDQLHDAVHSTNGNGNGSRGVHRSPLNTAAVELLHQIRRTIGDRDGLLEPALWAWRPADEHEAAELVTSWTLTARGILNPPRNLEGTGPCPACGTRWVWTRDGDEATRRAAIRIVITGRPNDDHAECLNPACATRWPRTHWDLLAAAMRVG